MEEQSESINIKNLLKSRKPILFKNYISSWPIIKFTMEDWYTKFKGKILPIRIGHKKHYTQQWERSCKIVDMNFKDFIKDFQDSEDKWGYFDYKHMNTWFEEDMSNMFDWKIFGVEEIGCRDSTLWIGTPGAHTPCHYDAYSFNLVAQISGRCVFSFFTYL